MSAALSETVTVAARLPAATGENVTEIVHVAFTASVAGLSGHVFVCAKSPGFAPPIATLEIVNGAVPEFLNVTDCAPLTVPVVQVPNARVVGVSVTAGAVPVPLTPSVWGVPGALSATETLAVRLPVALGENVTETVHVPPAARLAGASGQLSVSAKSPAFAPVSEIALIERG